MCSVLDIWQTLKNTLRVSLGLFIPFERTTSSKTKKSKYFVAVGSVYLHDNALSPLGFMEIIA